MKSELNREERNAIHEMIRLRLSRIDSIPILLDRNQPGPARREWKDCRTLVRLLNQIGWAVEDSRSSFLVKLSDARLNRALDLIGNEALSVLEIGAEDRLRSQSHDETPALITLRAIEELRPGR